MKMTIKIAFAVIYYVAEAFIIFSNTFTENDLLSTNEDIRCAIGNEEFILQSLVYKCKEQIGIKEEDVIPYDELINILDSHGIYISEIKDAVKILSNALILQKDEMEDIKCCFMSK